MLMAALRLSLLIGMLMAALVGVPSALWQSANVHELAFTLDNAIYRLDLNTGIRFLISAQAGSRDPVWSPDGERIAFTGADGESSSDLFVMDANGRELVNLTTNVNNPDDNSRVSGASWSPDGMQIAFLSDWGNPYLQVFAINLSTGGIRHISSDANYNGPAVWSPDGRQIAFDDGGDIHIASIDHSEFATISDNWMENRTLTWSPDGAHIAFTAGENVKSIYVMNRDGRELRYLVEGRTPAWSPDSRYIAFTQDLYIPDYHYEFAIIEVDTGVVQAFPQSYLFAFNPSWSPSGAFVAFGCDDTQSEIPAKICLLNMDTGTIITTPYQLDYFSPLAWRPDAVS